eukprot:TRINITY_DN15994_c0_g1_i2.p2 TRINITY_DN15994_c0_g1~~TRINITY_DN15994_c0_g1_i2.p2  ORF type:complete len:271 (+),score=91.33 TRINITY_DN15994_c0_g1_i2:76-813(+)
MAAGRVAFVAGSSGATGRELVRLLLGDGRYSKVIAAVRSPRLDAAAFPGLPEGTDRSKLTVMPGCDFSTMDASALQGADVVLTAAGTSRANPEVKAAMDSDGDAGFASWLMRVDVGVNQRLAELASAQGAKVFGRISARGADPSKEGGGFNIYWKHQGIADERVSALAQGFPKGVVILRPGRLDRGDELRSARPWEVEHHEKQGAGLHVRHVAERLLQEVDRHLDQEGGGVTIVEHDDIVAGAKM